jgi:uncharacterized protein YecT (DUF1311 family)
MLITLLLLLTSLTNFILQNPTPSPQPSPPQHSPQSCPNAKTQLDMNECFAQLYQDADAQLNAAYNNLIGAMKKDLSEAQHENTPARISHDQTAMNKLLAAQRAWLTYRDAHCDSVKFQYEGGSIQPTIWSQCMAETTQQRTTTLTTAYDLSN